MEPTASDQILAPPAELSAMVAAWQSKDGAPSADAIARLNRSSAKSTRSRPTSTSTGRADTPNANAEIEKPIAKQLTLALDLAGLYGTGTAPQSQGIHGHIPAVVADLRRAEGLPFIAGTEGLNRPANIVPYTGKANGPELQLFELKSLADDGTSEGLAAAYGNVDSHGDRIEPGAFKAAEGQQITLLFAHKTDEPVGIGTVTETPQGLWVKGKLLLDTVTGREAYTRLKAALVKARSVGFQLPSDGFSHKDGIRSSRSRCSKRSAW